MNQKNTSSSQSTANTKHIVIIGAGFAGVQAAINLSKNLGYKTKITLVDKRDYHLFTSNLYEVAAAEEELTTIKGLKKSITLPLREIFKTAKVNFVQKEVVKILPDQKKIQLSQGELKYDYLVLALGSQSNFFNIKGAEENSLTLKNLPDGLRIRNKFESEVQAHQMDANKKVLRVVVAGGGYTGLELAAELKGLADLLALKYSYPREKIEIQVIEANNKLVAGFDDRLSVDSYNRLMELQIKVSISARIMEVDRNFIFLMSGEKIAYDILVWTTGVKASPIESSVELKLDQRGGILTNEFLQLVDYPEIFAVGDGAFITDQQKKPVPPTAQDASHEGKYISYALAYILKNQKPLRPYVPKKHGFIVVLGGKWAIMSYNGIYLTGFIAWCVGQLAHLRYYASVVGWFRAVKYIVFQMDVYSRND
jgi:NADH dehydrogenase